MLEDSNFCRNFNVSWPAVMWYSCIVHVDTYNTYS